MSELSALEKDVMEEMYFVISFSELEKNVFALHEELIVALQNLLKKEMISQLHFGKNDFVKLDSPDFSSIEKSNFVASKKGLLKMNIG
jgi:hypothetical protein